MFKLTVESSDPNVIKMMLNAEPYRIALEEMLRICEEGSRIDLEEITVICKNNGINVE